MDKEQQERLVKAWELRKRIMEDILRLADQNVVLAYGVIRAAETLVDLVYMENLRKHRDQKQQEDKPNKVADAKGGE